MNGKRSNYYPVFLKLDGKKCTVVGGGQVALRKVKSLLECGASVEVISPQLCTELAQLAGNNAIAVSEREYQRGDLNGATIVIAATDSKNINLEVAREAKNKGALVNSVDDPENSDFIVPSHLTRGDITIAISTAGSSPALAKKIKKRLESEFGNEYAAIAQLVAEVRTELKEKGIAVKPEDWLEALDLDLLAKMVQNGEHRKAKDVLLKNLTRRG